MLTRKRNTGRDNQRKNHPDPNESDGDTNSNWCTRYSHQRIGIGTGGLGNKMTSGDHLNYSIVEICLNTKKGPGDLRKLAVTQI